MGPIVYPLACIYVRALCSDLWVGLCMVYTPANARICIGRYRGTYHIVLNETSYCVQHFLNSSLSLVPGTVPSTHKFS